MLAIQKYAIIENITIDRLNISGQVWASFSLSHIVEMRNIDKRFIEFNDLWRERAFLILTNPFFSNSAL
jgi:hypothetical protein